MLVRNDDVDLQVSISGNGPTVLLLHPFPSSSEFWTPLAAHLQSRYRLLIPDLRGLGSSSVGQGDATMQKHARDVLAICKEAAVSRFVVVGCSIGGYIAFELWRQMAERIAGIVFCDTKANADTEDARAGRMKAAEEVMDRGPEFVIRGMISKLLGESTQRNRPDIVSVAVATMTKSTAAGIAAAQRGMASRPDSTLTLPTITVPVLALAGDEDTLSPREEIEKIARGVKAGRSAVIPRAGHLSPFEQPEVVGKLIREFLDELPRWE